MNSLTALYLSCRRKLQSFFLDESYFRRLYGFPTRVVIDNDGWWTDVKAWPKAAWSDVALKPIVLN